MTCGKEFADRLIAGNGRIDPEDAPDNPWATRIVQYIDQGGKLAYGVTFEHEPPGKYLMASEFIRDPHIYWERAATVGRGQR